MKSLCLALIRFYRRFLSPYKGFSCAYRVHTGAESCSTYGLRVLGRFGVLRGIALIRRRTRACARVYRAHHGRARPRSYGLQHSQAGFCDVPCDIPCDLPCDGDAGGSILGACDGCDPFDLFDRDRKKKKKGQNKEEEC